MNLTKFYLQKTKIIFVLAMFLFAGLQGCNKDFFQEETPEKKDPLEAQLKKLKEQGETGVFSLEEKNGEYHLKKEDFKELDSSFWLGGSYDNLPPPPLCTFCGATDENWVDFLKCFEKAREEFGTKKIMLIFNSNCLEVKLRNNPKKKHKRKKKKKAWENDGFYAEFYTNDGIEWTVENVEFTVIDVIEDVELE